MRKRLLLLLILLAVAGAGAYAYMRMGPSPLVLTGIVTTNDVIVSAQIGGQIAQLLVKEGDAVTQGQTIAEMGADANGSGSMQFEVRSGGKPVDPLSLLPKPGG